MAARLCLTSGGDQPEPVPAPEAPAEKLTCKYLPRDEKTGERLRVEKRDAHGSLRQVEIHYSNNTIGLRYLDNLGRITKISRTTPEGNLLEGRIDKQNNEVIEYSLTSSKGTLLYRVAELASEQTLHQEFRADGTLLLEEKINGKEHLFKLFHDDGRTVHVEAEVYGDWLGKVRRNLKVYQPNGTLLYQEKGADPHAQPGQILSYIGTVHDANGKARQRLTSTEGQTSLWSASKLLVEDLNEDGTVAKSSQPERGPFPYRAKLDDPVLQSLVEAKDTCHKLMAKGHHHMQFWRNDLAAVLRD